MTTRPVLDALRALQLGDRAAALRAVGADRTSLLAAQLERYLRAGSDGSTVYDQPTAFQAFIGGGGNIGLYEHTAAALADVWAGFDAPSVLDIGCGDGAALGPALSRSHTRPSRVDLVEVSDALLDAAVARLGALEVTVRAHRTSAQDFAASLRADRHWDVVEATFALHAVPVNQRVEVLTGLRGHLDRIVIVEFDVPGHDPASEDHLRFLAETYEQGLAEYTDDRDLVAGGFLMPVLVGQLSPGATRVTYEQPAHEWAGQLSRCGYTEVEYHQLYPYWSAPAFVLTARAA